MVAFWEAITERGSAEDGPGASRKFPLRGSTRYTWCDDLFELKTEWLEVRRSMPFPPPCILVPSPPPWLNRTHCELAMLQE